MSLRVEMNVETDDWATIPDLSGLAERVVAACQRVSEVELRDGAEVSLLFADDAAIRVLNARWRQIDKPTNVLSFPGVGEAETAMVLGDIALAFETTQREAQAEGKTLADHTAHLIVHGFLHLLGFDHETDEEAEDMEAMERDILKSLGVPDPYAGTTPVNEAAIR